MKTADVARPSLDQRATERVEIVGHLSGQLMTRRPMIVRELGPKGAQIDLDCPLQLNSVHELRLSLGADALVVKGRVVHCGVREIAREHIVYRAGLEFVEPSDQVALVLASAVETLRSDRHDAWASPCGHLTPIDLNEA